MIFKPRREGFGNFPRTSAALAAWIQHCGPGEASPIHVAWAIRPGPGGLIHVQMTLGDIAGQVILLSGRLCEALEPESRARHVATAMELAWCELRTAIQAATKEEQEWRETA